MNLIRKFSKWLDYNNYNHSGMKLYGTIFGILFIISTLLFINFTFNVDLTEDYKVLSNVMEENRSDIEELIAQYNYGNVAIEDKCNIKYSKEEVTVTSYKEHFMIGRPEINYSVIKDKDSILIDERYTPNEYVSYSFATYLAFIVLSILLSFAILLCFEMLPIVIFEIDEKKKRNKKEIST